MRLRYASPLLNNTATGLAIFGYVLANTLASSGFCHADHPIEQHATDREQQWISEFRRACSFYRQGEWDKSGEAFNRAIIAVPEHPAAYAGRGAALIAQRKYELGITYIWKAIHRNPGDVADAYDPNAKPIKQLSAEALRHGETQVRQMLKDRPVMAKNITPGDKLWDWAVRKFAGEEAESLVYWEASDPAPRLATCGKEWDNRLLIQISPNNDQGNAQTFDGLWSCAVFELHNIASYREVTIIADKVMRDQITREEYIKAMFMSEIAAEQQTRAFYLKFFCRG